MIKKLLGAMMVGVLLFGMASCGPKAPADEGNGDAEETPAGIQEPEGQEGLLDE